MSGRKSRNKGAVYEREVVNWHRERGVDAERIPLSGAMKGNYRSDLKIGPSLALLAECKRRKRSFTTLYDAIAQDNSDMLFVRDDQKETLVVLPVGTWEWLLEQLKWKETGHE